jgi:hypothetical protein
MKKAVTTAVAFLAAVSLAGMVYAAEDAYPEQDATVTITEYDHEGKVVKEDKVSDTTKGADTAGQYKKLQKQQAQEEMKAGETQEGAPQAAPAEKKSMKKKMKKIKSKVKTAPVEAPAPPAVP